MSSKVTYRTGNILQVDMLIWEPRVSCEKPLLLIARPFPKGTVPFGGSNVPFGSAPKPTMCPSGGLPQNKLFLLNYLNLKDSEYRTQRTLNSTKMLLFGVDN